MTHDDLDVAVSTVIRSLSSEAQSSNMDAERLRDLTTHVSLPLYVGSALLGVSSHQIFRMKEPTIK